MGGIAAKATLAVQKADRRRAYMLNPKTCAHCQTPLPYEKRRLHRFCNMSCAASANNVGVRRHGRGKKPCLDCGVLTYNVKYCSRTCGKTRHWAALKRQIEASGEIPMAEESHRRSMARRYFKETQLWCCTICTLDMWLGKELPLVLDHVDGNSDNFSLYNLRLLCSNCDSQLPTHKGRNRGRGRTVRRLRRQEMKAKVGFYT